MSFKMECTDCSKSIEVEDEKIGQEIECPSCNSKILVKKPQESTADQENETVAKGKEMGQKAFNEAKEATGQAIKAIEILLTDPIGGQFEALNKLGSSNAFKAGIALIAVFVFSSYLLGYSFIEGMLRMMRDGVPMKVYIKLFIFSIIPSVSIFLCYLGIGKWICTEKPETPTLVFTTGVATLPLALLFICVKIISHTDLLSIIGVFCLSTTILLINSSLQDIYKLNSKKAVIVTPALLVVSMYISKILYQVLLR